MVGPSATGSENGTPSSNASAPAATTVRTMANVCSGVGSPNIRNGTKAPSPCCVVSGIGLRIGCSLILLLQFEFWVGLKGVANVVDILVSAAGQGDQDGDVLVLAFQGVGQRVRGFEGWNDAFLSGKKLERLQCFGVSNADILCAAASVKVRVLRPYTRVVQPGGSE